MGIMFEVDLEFVKNDSDTKLILSWIFTNTVGRFYSMGVYRYWFFEIKDDADRFKDKWYEIPFENYKWKSIEYEYLEDDILSKPHCIILYFPEEHDNGIKWKMHEWCEKNIGPYAGTWYTGTKQVPKNENQDILIAYIFHFEKKENAMSFRLVWS